LAIVRGAFLRPNKQHTSEHLDYSGILWICLEKNFSWRLHELASPKYVTACR